MYKKIRNHLIVIIVSCFIIVSAIIFIVNDKTWKDYSLSYISSKRIIIERYMESTTTDLYNILDSNAIWTDARNALISNDEQWLDDNAAGYVVEEKSYNIDFIYIASENLTFKKNYGLNHTITIENLESYKKAMSSNQVNSEIIWINDNPAIISAMPFYDNNKKNPTGCFLAGRILEDAEKNELSNLLTNNEVKDISFSKKAIYEDIILSKRHEVRTSLPLLQGQDAYLNVYYDVAYLDNFFNNQLYSILTILVLGALIITGMFSNVTKKVVNKVTEIISAIENISKGNYDSKLEPINSSMFAEINILILSVNSMARHISTHDDILNERYHEMINLLVTVVEMNDSYTYHHSYRVSEYAQMIGKAIGYKDLNTLELASMLHDIGKISIPTNILNKPSKLTPEEYEIIKKHPEEGYKLINEINVFKDASLGVLHHHERYDGKGYPNGLSYTEIPLIAQIISIADVFEALTSDRSYRKAMSHKEAMKILISEKGQMFNPELVEIFNNEMNKRYCI